MKSSGKSGAQKPANIYDVAKQANVSIKTVSRVVNGMSNISEATRQRVLEAVAALSYVQMSSHGDWRANNHFCLAFCATSRRRIGLHRRASNRHARALPQRGLSLIVESLDGESSDLCPQVTALVIKSNLHGVILTSPLCDIPAVLEALKHTGTPFVRIAPEGFYRFVRRHIDDYKAAYDMTAYLIGLGHKGSDSSKVPPIMATPERVLMAIVQRSSMPV